MGVPLSVALIARNCAEILERCLTSLDGHYDEIVVVNTAASPDEEGHRETTLAAEKFGAKVFDFPWIHDFAAARNFSFDRCSHDIVMWIDTDDVVQHADRLRDNINRCMDDQDGQCLVVEYPYEFDGKGECTTHLMRERVVDRRYFEWRMPIHECLCGNWLFRSGVLPGDGGRILHQKRYEDRDNGMAKLERNLEIFEKQYDRNTWDKRALFYWGNTLYGLGRHREAIEKYDRYMQYADNKGEMYAALLSMSEAHRFLFEQKHAQNAAQRAQAMFPHLPSAHLAMAESLLAEKDWKRAIDYSYNCLQYTQNLFDEVVCNPKALKGRPHFIAFYCFGQMMMIDKAMEHAQKAEFYYGDDENFKAMRDICTSAIDTANIARAYTALRGALEREGSETKIELLERSIPKEIVDEPEVARTMAKQRPSGKPSLAIYCAPMSEVWGPGSIESGIGGSEECVINVSKELAKLGWHVEVYAHTDARGEHDGVTWYPVRAWSGERDEIDVAIIWRTPRAPHDIGMNARTAYLWLHDAAIRDQWNFDTQHLYNNIFFLSRYHRSLFPWVDFEKAFITGNAMDPSIFVPEEQLYQADRWSIIWPSDPSRGLHHLAPWWQVLKQQFPKLEMHVFYGWSKMFFEHRKVSKRHDEIFQIVEDLRREPGVQWHGRVGQKEMNEWAAKCAFWPYMLDFPESYCINAIKMQAHGCWPIVPTFAALPETCPFGDKMEVPNATIDDRGQWEGGVPAMEKEDNQIRFVELLASRLEQGPPPEEQLREMVKWARQLTWELRAREWDALFRRNLECSTDFKRIPRGSFSLRRSKVSSTPRSTSSNENETPKEQESSSLVRTA